MVALKLINMIFTWKNIITQIILTQLILIAVVFAHRSSLSFEFTSHTHVFELTMSAFPFLILNLLLAALNTERFTILKLAQLIVSCILSFVLVYVLTIFSNNLVLAILGLPKTILFTIYGVWCGIVFTYLLLFSYVIFALMYDLFKSGIYQVETAMFLKVFTGYAGNLFIMSPLVKKVADVMRPVWGYMMQSMMFAVLTIAMVIVIVMFFRGRRPTI